MRTLYLAVTPFHTFLACGIALERQEAADLIVFDNVPPALRRAIRSWPASPFDNLDLLPSPNRLRSLPRRVWRANRNVARLRRLIPRYRYESAFVFNDGVAESQAVMHLIKRRRREAVIAVAEDGMGLYLNFPYPHHKARYRRALRKLLYGPWWVDIDVLGSSPWVDELWATFPQHLRPELRPPRVRTLRSEWFEGPAFAELARSFLARVGVELPAPGRGYALLALEHSSAIADGGGYRALIERACRQARDAALTPILKHHPLEPKSDPFGLERFGAHFLPRELAVEFLYVSGAPIVVVLGNVTTALASARWLLGAARVISIAPSFGTADPRTAAFFTGIGIDLVADEAKLAERVLTAVDNPQGVH